MSPINKYLAKLFFKTVVYSTTMWIIIELLRDGRENLDLVGAIMFGFLFSLMMVATMFYNLEENYQKNLSELVSDDLKMNQKKSIKSKLTLYEVKSRILDSNFFKTKRISFRDDSLKFKKRYSAFTWGEHIAIKQAEFNTEEEYTYEISSKPIFRFQLFDSGMNYRNVQELERLIS